MHVLWCLLFSNYFLFFFDVCPFQIHSCLPFQIFLLESQNRGFVWFLLYVHSQKKDVSTYWFQTTLYTKVTTITSYFLFCFTSISDKDSFFFLCISYIRLIFNTNCDNFLEPFHQPTLSSPQNVGFTCLAEAGTLYSKSPAIIWPQRLTKYSISDTQSFDSWIIIERLSYHLIGLRMNRNSNIFIVKKSYEDQIQNASIIVWPLCDIINCFDLQLITTSR